MGGRLNVSLSMNFTDFNNCQVKIFYLFFVLYLLCTIYSKYYNVLCVLCTLFTMYSMTMHSMYLCVLFALCSKQYVYKCSVLRVTLNPKVHFICSMYTVFIVLNVIYVVEYSYSCACFSCLK